MSFKVSVFDPNSSTYKADLSELQRYNTPARFRSPVALSLYFPLSDWLYVYMYDASAARLIAGVSFYLVNI